MDESCIALLRDIVNARTLIYNMKRSLSPAAEPREDVLLALIDLREAELRLAQAEVDYPKRQSPSAPCVGPILAPTYRG